MDRFRITDASCLRCFAMLGILGPALNLMNSFLTAVRTTYQIKVMTLKPRVRRGWPALSAVSTGLKLRI